MQITKEYPQEAVIVSCDKVNTEDPYDIIDSNIDFLNAQFDEFLNQEDVAADSLRSYYVDYFLGQLENSGFSQFVYNSGWNEDINQCIIEGLQAMGAVEHAAMLKQGEDLLNRMGPERVANFFASDYFDENEERDFLSQLDEGFAAAGEEEDLVVLNSNWLHQLPNLVALLEDEMKAELQRRAAAIPNLQERIAEALENEPREVQLIRALCVAAGHDLDRVTAGDPAHEFQGQNVTAWHFLTDQGHFLMVDFEGTAYMFEEGSDLCLCELEATKDYGPAG